VILVHRAYRQNRNNSVPGDLGGVFHDGILPTTFLLRPTTFLSRTGKGRGKWVAATVFGLFRLAGLVRPETNPLRAIQLDHPSPGCFQFMEVARPLVPLKRMNGRPHRFLLDDRSRRRCLRRALISGPDDLEWRGGPGPAL